jgi:hypothetical protein
MAQEDIEEVAARAEQWLNMMAAGAVCIAQDWDNRIDCLIRLPDGTVVGEMVALEEVTESRIRATGERLAKRSLGLDVALVDELRPPIPIVKSN